MTDTQPHLFPIGQAGRARRNDPSTSKDAAVNAPTFLRSQIADVLYRYGPMTDDELCRFMDLPVRRWPSIKTARSALKNDDVLVFTGELRPDPRLRLPGDPAPQRVWAHVDTWPRVTKVEVKGDLL